MNIVPFDTAKVPAVITKMFGDTAGELVGNNPGGGFPVISIKGKVFHIQRGDERTLVTKPGEDDPAASIEVVVVRANPNNSKVFYPGGYVEGSTDKPTCFSNDGVAPDQGAEEPQAKKCSVCPHNQWGARITESGKKAKACTDSRRLAIATVDTPADPMLLRVPAASLKNLVDYGKQLQARGIPHEAVVTKIGFDYSVAHPALTFKPIGLIGDAEQLAEIKRISQGDLVAQITGIKPVAAAEEAADEPAPTKSTVPASNAADAAVAAAATTKKATVKVEAPAPAPAQAAAPAPAPKPAAVVNTEGGSLEQQISGMLDNLDFDDQ